MAYGLLFIFGSQASPAPPASFEDRSTAVLQEVEYHKDDAIVTEVFMEVEYSASTAIVTEVEQEVEEHRDDVVVTSIVQGTEFDRPDVVPTSIIQGSEWNREDMVVTSIMQLVEYTVGAPPGPPPPTPETCPPFRVFWQDCEVRVKDWGTESGYRVIKPFGGPHQTPPSGAEI